MKYFLYILLLLTITSKSFSQAYMDEIVKKSCECLGGVSEELSNEEFTMELGLCMLQAASPYERKLKKDFKIDLSKIDQGGGEELGRVIGLKMATACPNVLMRMVGKIGDEEEEEPEVNTVNTFEGQVTKVEEDQFIVFSVRDERGRVSKFHWLTFVDSDINLSSDYMKLMDESVTITYTSQEFFDSRIGEYRVYNIIEKIDKQ